MLLENVLPVNTNLSASLPQPQPQLFSYRRAWETKTLQSFRAAFAASAGSVEEAAENQSRFFAAYLLG